jgi:hypothetical protein
MFASLAMYSEDPTDSIPIPNGDIGKGGLVWGISRIMRTHFEELMIKCLVLAADMTSSPQMPLRFKFGDQTADLGTLEAAHLGRDCYIMVLKGMLGMIEFIIISTYQQSFIQALLPEDQNFKIYSNQIFKR